MRLRSFLIVVSAVVFLYGCGNNDNIIQEHYRNDIILFDTYRVEFDIRLENIGYSDKTARLIKSLVYQDKDFDEYITFTENEFIGPVTSEDFPPVTDEYEYEYLYQSFLNESYNILHHNKNFVVIEYNNYYYYSGAAHGMFWTKFYNIDIKDGKILEIDDLLNPIPDDFLVSLINEQYNIKFFLREEIWPPDTVYINRDNIELIWNVYTITPYSDGIICLIIQDDTYLTKKGKSLKKR